MKLKCDLIIQNLNQDIKTNAEKLHKCAYIGLYRPKLFGEDTECEAQDYEQSCEPSDKTSVILTVETAEQNLKYKLKRIETFTKFIKEGKATLKLIDENIFLLISNTPALTLTNFISFLNLKLSKSNSLLLSTKSKSSSNLLKENSTAAAASNLNPINTKQYVNKLLSKVQCSLGTNSLTSISPLTQKDVSEAIKTRNADFRQKTESPIRAAKPGVGGNKLFRSQSAANLTSPSSGSKSLHRSSSCSDLVVQLTDEQKHILKLIRTGGNIFFTVSCFKISN